MYARRPSCILSCLLADDSGQQTMRKALAACLLAVVFAGTITLWPGAKSLTDIKGPIFASGAIVLALGVVWAMALGSGMSMARGLGWFVSAALVFLAYTAASALWAAHPWVVKYIILDRALMILLALAVAVSLSQVMAWRLVAAGYILLGVAVAAYALLWHGVWLHTMNDIRAPLGNKNLLAAALLLPMGFAAAFAVREWRGQRRIEVFLILAAALIPILAVFAYCRPISYGMSLAAGALVFLVLRARHRATAAAAGIVVAAVVLAALWHGGYVERFRETKHYIVRAELWRRAALMAEERPVLGWGAGNYFTNNQPFAADAVLRVMRYWEGGRLNEEPVHDILAPGDINAHNEYLEQAAEGGAAGLAIYMALLASAVASAVWARRRGFPEPVLLDAALGIYAAYLIANVFNPDTHFADFGPQFWILTGMLVASAAAVSQGEGERRLAIRPARIALAAALTAVAGYGIWVYAVEDWRSSKEYKIAEDSYMLGAEARSKGDYSTAFAYDRRIVAPALASARRAIDPRFRESALWYAGHAYLSLGDTGSAYRVLKELADQVDAFLDTDYQAGVLLEKGGHYGEALKYYRRYRLGHPEDSRTDGRIAACGSLSDLEAGRRAEGAAQKRD